MRTKVIISIDGGGIRGVIPLILLKEIQQRLSTDLFGFNASWWGTSTGALISGAINIQNQLPFEIAVQNVLDMYEFRSHLSVNPPQVSIPSRALGQLIVSNFGMQTMEQFKELNIVVSEEETLNPVVFNHINSCLIADAIRASCAFPGIFPAVEINGANYVDGFFKAKNPALLAYQSVTRDMVYDRVVVLSFGTGQLRAKDAIEKSVEDVHEELKSKAVNGPLEYFRLDPVLKNAVDDMQNTSAKNIFNLRKDTMAFITDQKRLILEIVAALEGKK